MTLELRRHVSREADLLRMRLNAGMFDPVTAALQARRLFTDAGDELRVRWLNLEVGGYGPHVQSRALYAVLGGTPESERLAGYVSAYRRQSCMVRGSGVGYENFEHFFVDELHLLVDMRSRMVAEAGPLTLNFKFDPAAPNYPRSLLCRRDVFDRVVLGFLAALYLQLGTLS